MNTRIPHFRIDSKSLQTFVDTQWDEKILPALTDYIAIPAKSPAYDAHWAENAYLERVVKDAAQWIESQKLSGLKLEIIRLTHNGKNRTPVLFFEVPAQKPIVAIRFCFMGTWTNSPNSRAGVMILVHGHLNTRRINFTAGGAQMTVMRFMLPSLPSWLWTSKASPAHAA